MIEAEFKHPDSDSFVVIRDNDETGYAYFVANNRIAGFVWLYNRVEGHADLAEGFRGEPLLNPQANVDQKGFRLPNAADQFNVNWIICDDGVLEAGIYIDGKLMAKVGDGDKPGSCSNAAKDSILAFTYH